MQIIHVEPTTLVRTLRLTGAVAYNGFRTIPVITQVSGPVSRIVVFPGQHVKQGEPMLYAASPDYSQLRTNYLKAKTLTRWPENYLPAPRIYTNTRRSRSKLWNKPSPLRHTGRRRSRRRLRPGSRC